MTTGQVYQSLHKATNSRTPPIEPALKQEKQLQKSVQKRKENFCLYVQLILHLILGQITLLKLV
jgi:hypothetical protein